MKIDDISGDEFGMFPVENRFRTKLSTFLPFLQLANSIVWYYRICCCNVLCRRCLCYWMCWHFDRYFPHHTLHQPAQELGRRLTKPNLSPSEEISPALETGTCKVLAPSDPTVCQ